MNIRQVIAGAWVVIGMTAYAEWSWQGKTGDVTLPAETVTVQNGDIADLANVTGIAIPEGGTLSFLNTSPLTLTAKLSGAGAITGTGTGVLELAADNTAHIGSMTFVGQPVTVTHRYGLGSATRVCDHKGARLLFKGNGLTNDVPLVIRDSRHSDALCLAENWTDAYCQNGDVQYYGGYWYFGNWTFTGGLTFNNTIYTFGVKAKCHAVVSGKPLVSKSVYLPWSLYAGSFADPAGLNDLTLAAPGCSYKNFALCEGTFNRGLICGCENALDSKNALNLGKRNNDVDSYKCKLDLNGYDQTVPLVCHATYSGWGCTPVRGQADYGLVTSARAATLTLTSASSARVAYKFSGGVSLRQQGTGAYTILNQYCDTTGRLEVVSGTVAFDWESGWGGDVEATGGSVRFLEGATLNRNGKSHVAVEDGAKLYVTNGTHLTCSMLKLGGETKAVGTYTQETDPDWIEGEGSVAVIPDYPQEPVSRIWTGAAGNGLVSDGNNWQGGEAPVLNGTEKLVFNDAGHSGTVTFPAGERVVYGIEFHGSKNVTLTAPDRIDVGPGGILSVNDAGEGEPTNTIVAAMRMDFATSASVNAWEVGAGTVLWLKSDIGGGTVDNSIEVRGAGTLIVSGDNAGLQAALNQVKANDTAVRIYSQSSTAMGAASRMTHIRGKFFRFEGAGLTNDTPIYVEEPDNSTFPFKANDGCVLVLNGEWRFTSSGVPQQTLTKTWIFRGGISSAGSNPWFGGGLDGEVYVEEKPLDTSKATSYFSLGSAVWHLASTNNVFSRIHFSNLLVCGATNALYSATSDGRVVLGAPSSASGATLDLNGYDQDIRSTSAYQCTPTEDYEKVGTVTSGVPAVIRMVNKNDNGYVPWRFVGAASFEQAGSGTNRLFVAASPTVGSLGVSDGRLELLKNASWPNVSSVFVSGGRLYVREDVANTAFGSRFGRSKAKLSISGTGVLEIAGGMVTVREFAIDGTDADAGLYGSLDCTDPRVPASHRIPQLAGAGLLNVKGCGLMTIVR